MLSSTKKENSAVTIAENQKKKKSRNDCGKKTKKTTGIPHGCGVFHENKIQKYPPELLVIILFT
jgi:hypothetical protein